MSVYFIQAGDDGLIKIGRSDNVERRLKALQRGAPVELRVLATFPGGAREEAALHLLLDADSSHGEWFRPTEAVLTAAHEGPPSVPPPPQIEEVLEGRGPGTSALSAWGWSLDIAPLTKLVVLAIANGTPMGLKSTSVAEATGLTHDQVERILDELEEDGLLVTYGMYRALRGPE